MSIKVTSESVQAEKNLLSEILDLHKKLLQEAKKLAETYQENQSGLGAHSSDLGRLIEALSGDNNTERPVKILTRKLRLSISTRERHINTNVYVKK